jgi:hypothetical protein
LMSLVEWLAAMADVEVTHFAFDAARIEVRTTADATPACDLCEQCIAPFRQALRGEWPQLAASCA